MTATQRRLGSGWAFPVHPDPVTGSVPYRTGAEKVREAIVLILSTEPGERLMRPSFGCPLRQYLMAPNTVATRAGIQRSVSRAIEAFEPRVRLGEVMVTAGSSTGSAGPQAGSGAGAGTEPSLVEVTVRYEHRRDGSPGVLVYPFYLERA